MPVIEEQIVGATALLEKKAAIPITAADASILTGKTLQSEHLYLVARGSLNEGNGGWGGVPVHGDDSVMVYHGSLGRNAVRRGGIRWAVDWKTTSLTEPVTSYRAMSPVR